MEQRRRQKEMERSCCCIGDKIPFSDQHVAGVLRGAFSAERNLESEVKIRNFQQDRRKARRKVKQEKNEAANRTAASNRSSSKQTSKSKMENTAGQAGAAKTRTKPNKKATGRQGEDGG